ncbi:MAG: transporter [Bacteroidia bacterium]
MRIVLLIGIVLSQILSFGQIETDRPDFTESPNVVPKGALQIETGFVYESTAARQPCIEEITNDVTINTTLLRYGVSERTELRLNWSYNHINTHLQNWDDGITFCPEILIDEDSSYSSLSPVFVGIKQNLHQGDIVTIGFLAHVYLPFIASRSIRPKNAALEFLLPFSIAVSDKFSVSAQFGMSWDGDNPEPEASYTLSLAYSITDQLGAYFEPYGYKNTSHAFGERDNRFNGGFTYLVNDKFQLDLSVGTFNGDGGFGKNYFVSGGFSYLFQP